MHGHLNVILVLFTLRMRILRETFNKTHIYTVVLTTAVNFRVLALGSCDRAS